MPFIETTYVNSNGAAASGRSRGENIDHIAGIRLRVRGSGV